MLLFVFAGVISFTAMWFASEASIAREVTREWTMLEHLHNGGAVPVLVFPEPTGESIGVRSRAAVERTPPGCSFYGLRILNGTEVWIYVREGWEGEDS